MAKEDLLTKQINQLGFFLRRMLEKITNDNAHDDSGATDSVFNQKLQEELGFDLKTIEAISTDEIIDFLLKNECFSPENLELFADILVKSNKNGFAEKALKIYDYINKQTAVFSMERDLKMQNLKKRL
ncbi:hypothetical protein FCR2A7T_10540 [Flavobacterium cauense R2A-7]|uniref:Uncharacterized protein n=1 Tax=Flavobacterium cauense R2A-7 TaxID=1341154 RepID=V6S2X1_9FLAO|nr:hypothetical protein [Flavobacterium cauense]ESU20744.1 hypothetical protein FCR2A7T_10540 [Flavobacterium cauense R2A-7]KGO82886.1 hypothetical protein Q762_03795 [Flavobacterium cauense R2A-7]TWI10840.1 hypothetical protein IP98_02191 [Flavobacterium cauense R2A-7]